VKPRYRPPVTIYRGPGSPKVCGACPHCAQIVSLTRSGKRRQHRDGAGLVCPGSGVVVELRTLTLDREKIRAAAGEVGVVRLDPQRTPQEMNTDERRATPPRCEHCGQNPRELGDGRLMAHRTEPFVGPYCPGGAPRGRA
jgi:hypothetical protein